MPTRVRNVKEGSMLGARIHADLAAELREARLARGLSLADVGRALGESGARVSRVELGQVSPGVADLTEHGAAVGLRLHARFYPQGGGLRDAAQLELLRRFRARIGDRWSWQLEAPLPIRGDQRAFDALLTRSTTTIAVEAITRLRDGQAQLRQATLKQRDGGATRVVMLIVATRHNREALAAAADVLTTAFPLTTRATLKALGAGEDPGDNGIVLM